MSNLRFDSVMGRVTLVVRVKTDCFYFGCRFEYGFGLFGSDFGSILPGLYVLIVPYHVWNIVLGVCSSLILN